MLNKKIPWLAAIVGILLAAGCTSCPEKDQVSTGSLLGEMLDLKRLTYLPSVEYHTIQYSSYDRNSKSPSQPGWFSNSDGFGDESIPGFEKILKKPDANGTGEYLICDIRHPGAILRLWTAGINGKIRLYLDGSVKPVFEGDAEKFFWNTIESISDTVKTQIVARAFRQYDAVYFPVPFSRRCRIEWIGNAKEIHFYHVTVRIYNSYRKVRTFKRGDIVTNAGTLNKIYDQFLKKEDDAITGRQTISMELPHRTKKQIFRGNGPGAIDWLALKVGCKNQEEILRKCILTIYFDSSSIPQVQAPVGDFFGAAPGLSPYRSLPFTVQKDSLMVCRFIMPFKTEARIEIENNSEEDLHISGGIRQSDYSWLTGKSMYFHARWKISNKLTASDTDITDIPYIMAFGKGRIVGVAAFIYNPSNAVTSWGNWWGEGDEKIYIDRDTFPSIFGTGSEDYFNYSWSSETLFSFPYCGQPRNDGPGNRGYVSNYRWHILDDIPYYSRCAFYMELFHHGVVSNFSYGRIVYFYSPGNMPDDFQKISMQDIAEVPYLKWEPIAYLGSAGYSFIESENAFTPRAGLIVEKGKLWAGNGILMWSPRSMNERIYYRFQRNNDSIKSSIGLTLAHMTEGGKISVYLNGNLIKFDGAESITLGNEGNTVLHNHFSESIRFKKGPNELVVENRSREKSRIGLDFIWLKKE